jgi:hypothetical protein
MKILADAWKNEEEWLWKRRGFISASDIFKLLTHDELCSMGWWREGWMDGDLDEILRMKRDGTSPKFKDEVAVLWGRDEEDHNRKLFERYSGIVTAECHYFVGNDRWKFLATTLDGFSFVPSEWDGLARPEMFDAPENVTRAIRQLPRETRCLLEMKQTSDYGVSPWADGYSREPRDRGGNSKIILGRFQKHGPTMPVYYLGQVQTQMALSGFHWNLAVVKGGASHMHAHAYPLSDTWLGILDAVNDRIAPHIEQLRKDLNAKK